VIARALTQAILIAALALLPATICGFVRLRVQHEEPLAPGEIRVESARNWGDQVQWVDARPKARFEAGHIPGAIPLNMEEWPDLIGKFLDAWDLDKTVVVYCDGGDCDASRAVADRLRDDYQVKSIYVLKGGWPAWQAK
jgi:rhodanese-related sulfurtransferase